MKKNDLRLKMIAAAGLLALCALGFTGCNNPVNTQLPVTAPHTEHTYGDWETVKAPTCTEKGQKKHKCTGCDKEETAEIDAKGHSFAAEWETDKDNHWHKATCGHDTEKSALGAHVDSDSDGKCDACSFDMTADWPAPKFVFYSDDSCLLAIYNGTLGWKKNFVFCEENLKGLPGPTWEDSYTGEIFILTPEIKDGKIIINENNKELTDKYVNTSHDIIYFIEKSEGLFSECRYYILYDELFKSCKEAGIEITSDVSKAFEAFNSAYVKFELETHQ